MSKIDYFFLFANRKSAFALKEQLEKYSLSGNITFVTDREEVKSGCPELDILLLPGLGVGWEFIGTDAFSGEGNRRRDGLR